MGILDNLIGKKKQTTEEIETETERLEAEDRKAGFELSIAQKKWAAQELKSRGVSARSFGNTNDDGTWQKIISWLKTH